MAWNDNTRIVTMAREGKDQMALAAGEKNSSDSVTTAVGQLSSAALKEGTLENSIQCDADTKTITQSLRKHRSEPLPEHDISKSEGRKCFERRRLWTASKQESFDLPEEFKCPTEDNVFAEGEMSRQAYMGKLRYRRSFSVPASLPDIVPERKLSSSENSSPDVVSFSENPKPDLQPMKSTLSTASSAGTELMMEEKEKKQHFEGTVHCDPPSAPQEVKRKKSVTFETAVQMVRIMSSRGIRARSHFRSSGYGSQSDTSQASQGSNMSSERGSIFSDDIVLEKRSVDVNDPSQSDHSSFDCTSIDGNVDNGEEEKSKGKTQEKAVSLTREHSQAMSTSDRSPETSKPPTPEEIDEIEHWSRQNMPNFHYGNMDDIPNLSIFEMTKENSGSFFPDTQYGSLPYAAQHGTEKVSGRPDSEAQPNPAMLPSQCADPLLCCFQPRRDSRILDGEGPENKSSPTTKEECQRELYKRLFEERMLQFDPSKESISDLFEWVKKNIGEALTPSPKSPFFQAERSPQNDNLRISPCLAAVTNALQGKGKPGNIITNPPPAPTSHGAAGPLCLVANQVTMNAALAAPVNVQGSRPVLAQGPGNQGMPPSHNPGSGVGAKATCPCLNAMQHLQQHQYHQQQPQPQQEPFHPPRGFRDGCGGGPGGTGSVAGQMNADPPPIRYQQDLPAIIDDVYSICISSSSEMNSSLAPSYVEQLVHISQCSYIMCTEDTCVQGKKSLHSLQDALKRGPSSLSGEDLRLLDLLNEHYNTCELPHCPVPWCRYLTHLWLPKEKRTSQTLLKLFSSLLLTLLPSQCQYNVFVKLDGSLPGENMPREWEDWLMLYPLSQSYTVARVTPLLPVWPHCHWVVKAACLHEERNQLEVYKKLRNLQHQHIIKHIWMAASFTSDILVVCSEFLPGVSVRDLLDQQVRLSGSQTFRYWLQILSAAQRLHELDIAFLSWTCGNLLLDDSRRTVKLTNFVASVDLSSGSADLGVIKLTLPADIVPAELLVQGGDLTHKTDSWGLACVLHEMLTGMRPWYHLRHCRPEDTWLQVLKQVPPSLTAALPPLAQSMIQHCLQKSPDCRLSVKDMMEHCRSQCF